MKKLRKEFVVSLMVSLLVISLLNLTISMGKLSTYFPNVNIANLLVEEVKENIKEFGGESSSTDGNPESCLEFDWSTANFFQLRHLDCLTSVHLCGKALLSFTPVHLGRFSPPPEKS